MIRIDSIKLKFPNSYIPARDNSADIFTRSDCKFGSNSELFPILKKVSDNYGKNLLTIKSDGEIKGDNKIFTKCRAIGLKSIQTTPQDTVIEFSAKILGKNYYDLINETNFNEVIENINNSGEIEIEPALFLQTAQVLKIDITNNIEMETTLEVSETIRDLGTLATGRKYRVTNYEGGYEIISQAKLNRERLIVYPKKCELITNKKINKDLQAAGCDFERFNNTLRIESNFKNFESIRRYFTPLFDKPVKMSRDNINEADLNRLYTLKKGSNYKLEKNFIWVIPRKNPITLQDIFKNQRNINYNKVLNMYPGLTDCKDLTIQNIIENNKGYKIEKILGRIELIWYYDYDLNLIRKFLQSKIKGNISRYIREYEELISYLKKGELINNNLIEKFINKLKEAA